MKKILLAIILVICFCGTANAQSTLALQEKCAEFVKKSLGEGGVIDRDKTGGFTMIGYTNHYNKKLDKCFALVSWTTLTHTIKGQEQTHFDQELWDAMDGKQLGVYYSNRVKEGSSWKYYENGCKVGDTICHSKTEFEALIKPYMEE